MFCLWIIDAKNQSKCHIKILTIEIKRGKRLTSFLKLKIPGISKFIPKLASQYGQIIQKRIKIYRLAPIRCKCSTSINFLQLTIVVVFPVIIPYL